MRDIRLTVPEFIFVVATRVVLGAGIAMLVSRKLDDDQRFAAGITATVIGAVTTVPALLAIFRPQPATSLPASR